MDYMKLDIQLFSDGKVVIDTELNTKNFENGLNKMQSTSQKAGSSIKNIVAGLGITKLIGVAMNQISSSLDGAISRFDTLNNFPKVMQGLGISAEESQKAIDKMSDKLAGLPTTLDQGANAVKRFTAYNGDVQKSTDMFLAVNNAILAGGASMELQSSALEQLTQAYTKGKPEAQDWKTIMQAMPAQLKQIAETMGYTSTAIGGDFYEALMKGEITMDDFMNTAIQLNEKGGEGFKSFAEQAKVGTEGIGTAITVAKTQVVKGMTDLIEGLNKGLQDANLPSIGEIIANVGKKAKETLDVVAKYLPTAIKLVKEIIPYLTAVGAIVVAWKFGSAIQKMVTGFQEAKLALKLFSMQAGETTIAQGLMNGTLKATEGIVALLTGKMTLAELAQAAMAKAQAILNAVMSANPIGLVVVAITALVAAFVLLWKKSEAFRNFWIGLWDGIKKVVSTAIEAIKGFFTKIIDFVKENWQGLLLLLVNPFAGAFKLLYDNCDEFKNFIDNFVQTVINFFTNLFNKISEWGKNVVESVKETAKNLVNGFVDFIKELPSKVWNLLVSVVSKIIAWRSNVASKAKEAASDLGKNFINGIKNLPSQMLSWGKDMIQGFINGIKSKINAVGDAAKGIAKKIKSILHFSKPDEGPLREYETWMPDMVKGLARTMEQSSNILANQAKELAEKIKENMYFDDVFDEMQQAIDLETAKMGANIEMSDANRTMQQAITASATLENTIPLQIDLDGEVIYDNQQKVSARKSLQYGSVK